MRILDRLPKKKMKLIRENGTSENISIIDNGEKFIITDMDINICNNDKLIEEFPNGNAKEFIISDINYFDSIGTLPKRYEVSYKK